MKDLRNSAKKKIPIPTKKAPHHLSTRKFNDLLERFNKEEFNKTQRLSKLIEQKRIQERQTLTYTPQILQKSRDLCEGRKPIENRVADIIRKKNQRLFEMKNKKMNDQLKRESVIYTFSPFINRINQKSYRTQKEIFQNFQEWSDRKSKNREKKEFQKIQDEMLQCNFQPVINQNSRRIANKKNRYKTYKVEDRLMKAKLDY